MTLAFDFIIFKTLFIPMIVPPVPEPAMKADKLGISFTISTPVVLKWQSMLSGLLNCRGLKYVALFAHISSLRAIASLNALSPTSMILAP
jgi:hypothetical protein